MPAPSRRTDAEARVLACTEFARPLVVEAGAGTGKTTTLIARISTWCVGPGWDRAAREVRGDDSGVAARTLDGVVAITFTEAAAAEMASRFGSALVEIAAGRPIIGLAELPVRPEEAARRARALLGAVDRLKVSTIHAFCAHVLATAPTEAGLHPAHRVDADGTLLAEVVHEVVVDWFTEVFGGDLPDRDRLLLLAQRGVGSDELVQALTKLAAEAVPTDAIAAEVWTDPAIRRLFKQVAEILRPWLARLQERLRGAMDPGAAMAVYEAHRKLLEVIRGAGGEMATVHALIAAAGEVDDTRVKEWAGGRFTAGEGRLFAEDRDAIAEGARAARRLVHHLRSLEPELLEAGRGVLVPLLERVHAELRRRGIVTFSHLLRGARDLLRGDTRLRARFRQGLTQLLVDEFQDTDDLQCDLVRLLALDGAPQPGLFLVGDPKQSIYGWRSADLTAYDGFVREVLAAGGEQLVLDVNRRSLTPILDEVARVIAPVMRYDAGYQAEFQPLRPARDDAPPPPEPWAPVEHWVSWKLDAAGARQDVHAEETTRLEAAAVAADLLRLRHATGMEWGKAAILLRSTGDLETYLSALRDAAIPFVVERNRQYFRRREIIDACAVVRCVLEPEDTLALLTVLRSPLVGAPDAALLPLWRAHLPAKMAALHGDDAALLAEIRAAAEQAAGDAARSGAPGIERVAGWHLLLGEFAAAIGALRAAYEALPADRFVALLRERLPLETLSAARYLGAYRLANLQRFYGDLVGALSAGDAQTVLRTLRTGVAGNLEAEEARPPDMAGSAVRILTIHKAKGLDFEHVYLVQLHKGRRDPGLGRRDENAARAWRGGWEYQLFGARTPGWAEVGEHDTRIEAEERVRLLYVAMTRAKDRLVLLGDWPDAPEAVPVPAARNLLDLVAARPDLPSFVDLAQARTLALPDGITWRVPDAAPRGHAETPVTWAGLPATVDDERARRAAARARMARPTSAAASEAAHRALDANAGHGAGAAPPAVATAVGTAVHRAIETMDLALPKARALEAARRAIAESLSALDADDHAVATERAARLIERFVDGKLGARLRSLAKHVLARELPILSAPDSDDGPVGFVSGAIDLLYRDPATGEVVVVDYKTDGVRSAEEVATRADTYRSQTAVYVRAVQAALGLPRPPRSELWFVAIDEVVVL